MSMRSDDGLTDAGPLFEGRYSDGQSAAGETVTVRFTERGLEIRRTSSVAEPMLWPYGGLTAATPLGAHAIEALIGYRYDADATVFVPSGPFARRLAERAPHLTARATRMRHAAPWLWAAAAVALVAGVIWLMELSPARAIARLMPDGVREQLGQQVVASMTANRKVCAEPAGRAALDRLIARLAPTGSGGRPFDVVVVDWGLVNAFAAPGEQIVLTRGLIRKAESADEVAGVLAHEMGHGIEMHPESGIVRALGLSAAMDLMLGGTGGTLGNIGLVLAQISYTRGAEREADRQAIRLLREARIPLKGLADFFRRIDKEESGGKAPGAGSLDLLRTHPASAERAAIVAAVPPYPASPAMSATEWQALRGICAGAAQTE